ncbi:PREDICTED: coiled-coil domain-containing protein 172 isoform X1 [Poecilia mexicana]|uniref:coiled-coil domain-containing protein 172 isoform X1 n=1 Tax=Poecilia mexicana TaxID=48701 RepID=UPI00072E674E|nr:PREDICTED: coiled-coil domain-containing protein 172 isoform X1 [Poecilia mexicana]
MSLDSLFQQILQTEYQLSEQTQKLKDVKVEIIRCNEKIKSETDKYKQITEELDKKAEQLSTMTLQCDMMRKCKDQALNQIEEQLCQQSHLMDRLARIKKESKEEEQQFLQEITKFNTDFSLAGNSAAVLESQTHAEILALHREVEALLKEMDEMKSRNSHMSSTLEERRRLLLELQELENIQRDLDRQTKEARAQTDSLGSEVEFVSQKHLTDSACLSLRKELELQKDEDLEQLRRSLTSEVQLLQEKLKSSQESEQH